MNTLPATLSFENHVLHVVRHDNRDWFTSAELATVLGYQNVDSISNLYNRHRSEFRDDMTCTTKLMGEVQDRLTRLFSLRGAYLISMKAHTAPAKRFRVWALDVLEGLQQVQPVTNRHDLPATTTLELDKDTREVLGGILKGIVQKALKELLATQQQPQPVALPLAARLPNPNLHGVFADVIEMLRSSAAEDRAALMADMRAWRSDFWFQMKGQMQHTDRITGELEGLRKALHSERSLSGRLAAELAAARQAELTA
jgi:prophage antirepressor-like protein